MKPSLRYSCAILALIMMTAIAAKGTTVTGTTISSGDGQLLTNARVTAEFIPKQGTNGSPVITSVSTTTDALGTFTMTLTDVNTINPKGGTWKFTVCPNATVSCTIIPGVVITGTTQEIGGLITANIPTLSVSAQTLVPKAYNNSQVPVTDLTNTGALYWNTIDKTIHLWDGTVWTALLSASGNNGFSGNNIFSGNNVHNGTETFNNLVNINNLLQVSGGNNVAGGLNYITRLNDSAGNAALDVLADTQRAGGLRRPPTNLLGLGDRVYIYDNLQIERRIWGDESFALTSKVSPITSTTLTVASAVGDTVITVAATPGSWTVDVEIEFGSLLGGSHETRSITAINGNVLSLNYPLRYIHTIGSTVQRFRWRGAIYPVNTDDLTPNGTLSIGASESALEATSFPETISQETHVSYNSQLASNMLSMIAFGGDTSAGTGMSVNVIGGIATVSGNAGTGSPGFTFQATAQNGVTIAAADPTNPRIDVIYWDLNGVVRVITGTPAVSPGIPVVPAGGTKLYEITVPAGAVSSASFTLTDRRATYAGWKPADPANNGTRIIMDATGRYIKCRISGTPTWACGAFDQNNASQPLRIETPFQVGTNGTSITTIVGAAAVLTYGAIAAQTCQEQPLTVANASVTNNGVFASPRASLGSTNLSWSSWVSAAGIVSVRVCNQTAGALTPAAVIWGATVIQ